MFERRSAAPLLYSPDMEIRQCDECGTPVETSVDGVVQCPTCLTTYVDSQLTDDTIIEESLSLSDVLRMVSEAQR